MRILLTGATGLVGRHLLDALIARDVEVHAVARRVPSDPLIAHAPGVSWRQCDLLRRGTGQALVEAVRPTHLIHAAWTMEPGRVWTNPDNLDWVGATLDLVRALAEAGGERAVIVGTCAEYAWNGMRCHEALTPIEPASLYGAAKAATYRALSAYARQQGIGLCWARLFNLYGPHEDRRRLVAGAASALLAGRRFAASSGSQMRDFMYVVDMAETLAELALSRFDGAINVASGVDLRVAQLLATLARLVGREDLLSLGAIERQASDANHVIADIAQLRAVVTTRPQRTLEQGLAETLEWHRSQL